MATAQRAQLSRGFEALPAPADQLTCKIMNSFSYVESRQPRQPIQRLNISCCMEECVAKSGVEQRSEYQHECLVLPHLRQPPHPPTKSPSSCTQFTR